jgi:SAM-dependent methyltransferase
MTVTDLIFFKNQLDKLSIHRTREQANTDLNQFVHVINSHSTDNSISIGNRLFDVMESFNAFEKEVDAIRSKLKSDIEQEEKVLFQKSYSDYQDESIYDDFHILGRRWQPDLNLELYYSRIKKNIDWHYPAMLLRPGYENFIDEMVGYDPLYLVDVSHKFIMPALNKFNDLYQNRLCVYAVKEDPGQAILTKLPDNQFGMVVGCHYFNFRPLEVIKQYLEEIYNKLRPGGLFMLTFNDCDRWSAVKLVEDSRGRTYTPGSLIFELAKSVGYTIDYCWHDEGPQTWLELRKPGELKSLRGGQTLAKIISKEL